MADLAIEAVALVGLTAIGLSPVLQSLFEPKKDQTTIVKVVLGETLGDLSASLSGNVPGVALWDELGRSIGTTSGTSEILPQGNFINIEVAANPEVGNVRPSYLAVSNGGNDAICIAGITITFPDNTKAAWNGDIGAACGAQFFESTREFNEDRTKNKCIWIDRVNSLGLKYQGFGFHIGDFFGNAAQTLTYNTTKDLMCKSGPRFRMYEKLRAEDLILTFKPPLEYNEDRTDKDPSKVIGNPGVLAEQDEDALRKVCMDPGQCKKLTAERCRVFRPPGGPRREGTYSGRKQERDIDTTLARDSDLLKGPRHNSNASVPVSSPEPRVAKPFDATLVISALADHSARLLCGSENSWGPSFVSMQELSFCDMESKTLYNLCSENQWSCCFDLDQYQLRPCFGGKVRRGNFEPRFLNQTKTYTKIRKWGMN